MGNKPGLGEGVVTLTITTIRARHLLVSLLQQLLLPVVNCPTNHGLDMLFLCSGPVPDSVPVVEQAGREMGSTLNLCMNSDPLVSIRLVNGHVKAVVHCLAGILVCNCMIPYGSGGVLIVLFMLLMLWQGHCWQSPFLRRKPHFIWRWRRMSLIG